MVVNMGSRRGVASKARALKPVRVPNRAYSAVRPLNRRGATGNRRRCPVRPRSFRIGNVTKRRTAAAGGPQPTTPAGNGTSRGFGGWTPGRRKNLRVGRGDLRRIRVHEQRLALVGDRGL